MFDFLGTFNRSQLTRLATYARSQLTYVKARVQHLTIEKQRVGFLKFTYDSAGQPTRYETGQPGFTTYIGKLMSAYEVLGGDPFYDLQVRSMSNPVSYTKGTETYSGKVLSNGEPVPSLGLADAVSGNAVRSMRDWMSENLDRLERIERKVRRATDYSDQLQIEIDILTSITNAVEVDGSLENLIALVNQLFTDPSYRAIADDQGKDPFGKMIYSPMSSYDQGGTRAPVEGLTPERGSAGYTVGGSSNS